VDPSKIGTGAGAALMTAALADLAPRPVAVWVLEGNAVARAFYERFGLRHDGVSTDFDAGGTPVPEIRYVLDR
jgi:RimJ/RimL family protein N-acetyltransferase